MPLLDDRLKTQTIPVRETSSKAPLHRVWWRHELKESGYGMFSDQEYYKVYFKVLLLEDIVTVLHAPNPKRPCHVHSVTSSSQNTSSLSKAPGFNQSDVDSTISSIPLLPDLPLFSSSLPLAAPLVDCLIKSSPRAGETSGDEFDQDHFLNLLDAKSLMQAFASVPWTVYATPTDLTISTNHVDDGVVCIMIHRVGEELRSLKLGRISRSAGPGSLLTRSCLSPLSFNHGFAGDSGNTTNPLEKLGLMMRNCRLIEHLFVEHYIIEEDMGFSCKGSPLETLILRDCYDLKEDIYGLVSEMGKKTYEPKFPIEEKKQRPGFTFVAIFESLPSSSSRFINLLLLSPTALPLKIQYGPEEPNSAKGCFLLESEETAICLSKKEEVVFSC
ncbi:unnamed protein product [Arabis nemorensis]|uniref:Uncharacterized protein n=1 Tax=Arabis nemorensis TaxID=586526 RepID=A0A565CCJ6_9BRAS|nr:unnamed protein product [Arabis nemorensis]